MKLSELFREAQTYLATYASDGILEGQGYSCHAIKMACRAAGDDLLFVYAIDFAEECGVYCNWTLQFDEFKYGEERQCARFMWLEMLALLADDEGL